MLTTTFLAAAVLATAAGPDSTRPVPADSIKDQTQKTSIAVSGEQRTRSEWDKPMSGAPSDLFTLMRTRLALKVQPSSTVTVFLQGQDSRVFGDGTGTARQTFDLHQGYVQLSHNTGSHNLELRAGRQELSFGNSRLIEVGDWSNFGKAYDGLRTIITSDVSGPKWSLDLFAATMEERGRKYGIDRTAPRRDQSIGGAFLSLTPAGNSNTRLDVTALADAGAAFRSYSDAHRYTLDVRLTQADMNGLRLELEGALQLGKQDAAIAGDVLAQDINASLIGVRVGNAVKKNSPLTVTFGADLLSGDETPQDNKYSAFNILNGSNHTYYGLLDFFSDPASGTRDRGLQDFFVQGDVRLTDRLRFQTQIHKMMLATGENRDYGWEADFALPFAIDQDTRVELGYATFRAGNDAASVGLAASGKTQHLLYLQLRAGFRQ